MAPSWSDHCTKTEITKAIVFEIVFPCFCLSVCLFCIQVGSVHAEFWFLKECCNKTTKRFKQPFKANYFNLTQHTVHLFSGVKKKSHEQVYVGTFELV